MALDLDGIVGHPSSNVSNSVYKILEELLSLTKLQNGLIISKILLKLDQINA